MTGDEGDELEDLMDDHDDAMRAEGKKPVLRQDLSLALFLNAKTTGKPPRHPLSPIPNRKRASPPQVGRCRSLHETSVHVNFHLQEGHTLLTLSAPFPSRPSPP